MRKLMNSLAKMTLIEWVVVVLIITILVAIAVPTFLGAKKRAECREGTRTAEECRESRSDDITSYCEGNDKVFVLREPGSDPAISVVQDGCKEKP